MSMSFEICSFTPYMLRRNKIEFDLPESSQGKLRLIDNTLNQQLVRGGSSVSGNHRCIRSLVTKIIIPRKIR